MPPEVKAISEEAGLWRPEDVAKAAIDDMVQGNFGKFYFHVSTTSN